VQEDLYQGTAFSAAKTLRINAYLGQDQLSLQRSLGG